MKRIMRSEAHYAAMLYRELHDNAGSPIRERFLTILHQHSGTPLGEIQDVCVEPAPFRDAWCVMPDSERRELVEKLLEKLAPEISVNAIGELLVGPKGMRSPAVWDTARAKGISPKLLRLKALFQARSEAKVLDDGS